LEREPLLQQITDVNPPVVLLAGQGYLFCQLSGPVIGEADGAPQTNEEDDPGSARQHKVEDQRDEDERDDPPVPELDGGLSSLCVHAASIPDLICSAKDQEGEV
jgi:hypothetical protein